MSGVLSLYYSMLKLAIEHLAKVDPILGKIIATIPPPEVHGTHSVFHDLMSCVIEQQIHYRSTKKVFQKMLDKSNLTLLTPANFPEFERTAFAGVQLSVEKYETMMRIVQHWDKNAVDWEALTDEEVQHKLSEIKGVGKWTIEMILLFTLRRPDVFSYDDYHIKQIMTPLYNLNPQAKLKAQLVEVAKPWSPYRSTAFHYLIDWKKFNK